jgi:hypothetical protein
LPIKVVVKSGLKFLLRNRSQLDMDCLKITGVIDVVNLVITLGTVLITEIHNLTLTKAEAFLHHNCGVTPE